MTPLQECTNKPTGFTMTPTEEPLFILGMHRSGTSCLTGCLGQSGFFLGEVNRHSPYNQRGNQENWSFVSMNNGLLEAQGGSWRNPPAGTIPWTRADREAALQLVFRLLGDAGAEQRPLALKDPRTLLTLDFWNDVCPGSKKLGVFRNPIDVAASLAGRSGGNAVSAEDGLRLWTHYNRRLLQAYHSHPFRSLNFDEASGQLLEKLTFPPMGNHFS